MKNYNLSVKNGGSTAAIFASGENSILDALRDAGITAVSAPCGGRGVCGKCAVQVKGMVKCLESGEVSFVDGAVLSCRYAPAGDCEIRLEDGGMNIALADELRLSGGGEGHGLAVDIGTTTIAMALYDLESGRCIAQKSSKNNQGVFGADVISRIEHCRNGSGKALYDCLDSQLLELTADFGEITKAVLVGNTVMEHFAAHLDPSPLAVPPFTPQSLFGQHIQYNNTDVYLASCVSAYVGGDILAGMLACGLQNAEESVLYVDIGTNGEIVFGNKNGFSCCATAAGPAFEGAEIDCGMNATDGAIDSVYAENGEIFVHVIGEGEARGICGSGLIDAVAVMLSEKIIGRSGRFARSGKYADRIVEVNGVKAFRLSEKVYLSIHDVHKVQLAKAAIRAGIDTLLKGRTASLLIIAGGFGKHISIENAVKIGLLPEICAEKIRQAGNAAASGAALLLEPDNESILNSLAEKCSYIDLSSSSEFSDNYLSNLNF